MAWRAPPLRSRARPQVSSLAHAGRPGDRCNKMPGLTYSCLILQLSFLSDLTQASSPVTCFRYGLMNPTPERPCEEVVERDAGGELEAANETTDLACAEVDHRSRP